jgi:peptidoglycan hydrolase-like protein with peptidoglycan-binding domain
MRTQAPSIYSRPSTQGELHMRYTTLLAGALGMSVALVAAPGAAAQDTTRTREVSTGTLEGQRIDNRGLSRAQVERLQARLNEIGCEAGAVDGLIGPVTRRAIECARQRENVTGTGLAALMRALGLEEAAGAVEPAPRDTTPRDTVARDTMRTRDPMRRDTMPMRDTTMRRDTLAGDSLRLQRDTIRRDSVPRLPRDTVRDTMPPPPPIR